MACNATCALSIRSVISAAQKRNRFARIIFHIIALYAGGAEPCSRSDQAVRDDDHSRSLAFVPEKDEPCVACEAVTGLEVMGLAGRVELLALAVC